MSQDVGNLRCRIAQVPLYVHNQPQLTVLVEVSFASVGRVLTCIARSPGIKSHREHFHSSYIKYALLVSGHTIQLSNKGILNYKTVVVGHMYDL
jgi:hypothetical protein